MKKNKQVLKKNEQVEVKEEPKEVSEVKEKSLKELQDEAIQNKAILDANDTEKAKKDVLLMKVSDLETHTEFLNKRINELGMDYEKRKKLVDGINGSIAGAQAELQNVRNNISKENEKKLAEITSKLLEIDKADKTLRALMAENEAINVSNRQKESVLIEERLICFSQVEEMKKALTQNNVEWAKREKDILDRENVLKEEKDAFEKEKASLAPEMSRISSIKNENILLLQEIERERLTNRNIMLGIESERQRLEEDKLIESSKVDQAMLKVQNEDKRLREWEQNVKEFELEVRAKSGRADKLLREIQLQKDAALSK